MRLELYARCSFINACRRLSFAEPLNEELVIRLAREQPVLIAAEEGACAP